MLLTNRFSTVVFLIISFALSSVLCKRFRHMAHDDLELLSSQTGPSKANLLFSKTFLNQQVFAVGWKIVVIYEIFNVGDKPALDIRVSDDDFKYTFFDILNGQPSFRIEKLLPGANVTFNVTVLPNTRHEDYFQFTPAKITYQETEVELEEISDEVEVIHGFSSLHPSFNKKVQIFSQHEADQRFGSKLIDYLILIVLTIPTVIIPMSLWLHSVMKYKRLAALCRSTKKSKKSKQKLFSF